MSDLPAGLAQAFRVAAAELGMCSASWLFVRELSEDGGDDRVEALRDRLGRDFPVLDTVAAEWLGGARVPHIDPGAVVGACSGANRVLVVGVEAAFLDALVPRLDGMAIALLSHSDFEVDWDRVLGNFDGRVERTDLSSFQAWGGRRSVLLTFAYGSTEHNITVSTTWLRVMGEDVRTQFRTIVAWDTLHAPMYVYPRWLVEVPLGGFTQVV